MVKEDLVKQLIERNERLKNERVQWESLWNLSGQYVNAQIGSMSAGTRTPGEKRGTKIYDGTPESAKDVMVAGIYSGLCPDAYKWFAWSVMPPELFEVPEVKQWLESCEDITFRAINDSNYGDVAFQMFESQVAFGTGVKYIETTEQKIINCRMVDLTECVFVENDSSIVDTIFLEYVLSARDAMKRFKPGDLPDCIRRADESGNKDDEFKFLHCVYPRGDYDPSKRDLENMSFASVHIYPGERLLLSEGGYRTFPFSVSRMYKQGRERYGRGPAIKAISDMGVLNEMAATNLIAGQRMVEPALQAPDDGYTKNLDLSAGAINFYQPNSGEIRPIVSGLNIPFGLELQDRQARAVQRWFHVDVFLAITQADNRMTATEALERKQEKVQLLGPVISRQKREHLDSDLDRIFNILFEDGYFPPAPEIVYRYADKIQTEYMSPLFLAQRRRDSDSILSVLQKTALIAQATGDPSVLDNFDVDKAYAVIADREKLPSEVIRSPEAVRQLRWSRQQQQQAMTQAQAGMAAVEAAKSIGQIPLDPAQPNAMTALLGMGK
jgi:hypothetical protein